MRRGEVVRVSLQPGTWVVISGDTYNGSVVSHPVLVPLVRRKGFGSEFAVETNEMDPIAGSILIPYPEAVPNNLPTELLGLLTGQTVERVREALGLFYEL